MNQKVPNELHREFLGVNGLNPWDGFDSSSRKQMFSSHIGQTLVVKGGTERFCQTGMEREYAKYTFSVKIPVDAEIVKVIQRYQPTVGQHSIAQNPQTVILYEDVNTKEIGMVSVTGHCSYHQYFGFQYKATPAMSEIRQGAFIQGGKILQDSPSVTSDGGYKFGVECNMAFMSMPAASEDGILISRDILHKFSFKTYETRVVEFGSKRFPLNLYGTEDEFKFCPDIGDVIRPDGILMGLRSYDETLAVIEQNKRDLMQPNFIFDKLVYAAGAGGKIVDIRVHHDPDNPHATVPLGMQVQAEKYDRARRKFYQEILTEYHRLKRQRGDALRLTPEFHRMVVEAISVVSDNNKGKSVRKIYRQAPLDDWRIEFVIEYDVTPTVGFKLTDCHGGKGVICHIAEPHEMPVDEAGNRADIVMDPNSTVSRMNLGRLYEQYINAASRDAAAHIRQLLEVTQTDPAASRKIEEFERTQPERFQIAWEYLVNYYKIVSPKMFVWMTDGEYAAKRSQHLTSVVTKGIYLYLPPDNDPQGEDIIAELERSYKPIYGPVQYVGNSGRLVTTKDPVRIGSLYVILLEKTADDWTAVASGRLQHFGVLSQVTNADKFSQPSRVQAIRALGESEVRSYVSYAGEEITAEILDRNNNPRTHKQILGRIFQADQPTNIDRVVNRAEVPLGGSKPLQLVKHIAECGGWRFVYKPYQTMESSNARAADPLATQSLDRGYRAPLGAPDDILVTKAQAWINKKQAVRQRIPRDEEPPEDPVEL